MKMKAIAALVMVSILLSIGAFALAAGDRYDLSDYEYRDVVTRGRGDLVFQSSPRGSFMKNHKFSDGDAVYVNVNWRSNGYAIAYEDGEYGYVDASYIDWGTGYTGGGSSSSGRYLGTKYVVDCNEYVTLRRYADTGAASVARVYKGESVEAYYYNGTFCECYYNGIHGYILSQYLADEPYGGTPVSPYYYSDQPAGANSYYVPGEPMGSMRVVNCDEWVSLREYASTNAPRIAKVPLGAVVEATWYNYSFAECEYHGATGYILLKYLR